jgi:hypothetical protein
MTAANARRRHYDELLEGLTPSGFHYGSAPRGTSFPYILVASIGTEGVANGMGEPGANEFDDRIYAQDESRHVPGDLADAIYTALSQATTTQGDYEVFTMFLSPYEEGFTRDGRTFRQEGGDYRTFVRPLTPEP